MAEENIYIKNHVTVQAYRGKTLDIKLNKFDQMHFITEKNEAMRNEYKQWLADKELQEAKAKENENAVVDAEIVSEEVKNN
jgi:hypothetical protein